MPFPPVMPTKVGIHALTFLCRGSARRTFAPNDVPRLILTGQTLCRLVLLLLSLCAAAPAFAGERGPACREPSVVDEITRQVKARNYYDRVDPRLVTEQPTADPQIVRCQVCVLSAPYDTTRLDDHPIEQCVADNFEVRMLPRGFVVRDLR